VICGCSGPVTWQTIGNSRKSIILLCEEMFGKEQELFIATLENVLCLAKWGLRGMGLRLNALRQLRRLLGGTVIPRIIVYHSAIVAGLHQI